MEVRSSNCIATAFGRVQDSFSNRTIPPTKDDNKTSRLEITNPLSGIQVHKDLGIVSSSISLTETLTYLRAVGGLPELSPGYEFTLIPADEVGLRWLIGETDHTEKMYAIAKSKGQTPMVLISRLKT